MYYISFLAILSLNVHGVVDISEIDGLLPEHTPPT